jgi:aryl sulfotransferase
VTAPELPELLHRYDHAFFDSGRWRDFSSREDDIFICSAYKAGTTWLQRICALLVFQDTTLGGQLGRVSPWLERETSPIEEVLERLDAQEHRRFIKTHTPLDGMPFFEQATYLFIARDPRDIFMSMHNHIHNSNANSQARQPGSGGAWPDMPDDIHELFEVWMTRGWFDWEDDGWPSWSVTHHARTFWAFRHLPNIHLLHYADLKADLDREMWRISDILGIARDPEIWPDLVDAATFDRMRGEADRLAPGADKAAWLDNARFFNKGTSGQWRDVLTDRDLALYRRVMDDRLPPDLVRWLEEGGEVSMSSE